ncbi:MAG: hypothetical protein J6B04_05650 [Clostridia bacterium]|nr:hypothetical protein [Clostridia bacterium]
MKPNKKNIKKSNSNKKQKYSDNEKRAYWIGYGAAITGASDSSANSLFDERLGYGQRSDLIKSAEKGFNAGKKNRISVPFEKGHNRYPVTLKDSLKSRGNKK